MAQKQKGRARDGAAFFYNWVQDSRVQGFKGFVLESTEFVSGWQLAALIYP